ncbi:hypothetical protein PVAND_016225 [Polypedilum vanderplanki]|uniref:Gustatory receptor n=1 Tax=Polypedilum vanderplanki TaxID=319348 RepID=A0A9J6BFJ9_POLVA|nr:hypothetical protein PVAND_016225 [Polypedilum vanderplanki]
MLQSAYDAISSLHFTAKFFGISLFTINPLTFRTEFKFIDLIFSFIAMTFYVFIVYIYYTFAVDHLIFKSEIITRGIPIMMTMQIIIFTILIILSNIKSRDLSEMLKCLVDVDKNFEYFGIKIDYKIQSRIVKCNLIKTFAWIIFLISFSAVSAYFHPKFEHRVDEHLFFFWNIGISAIVMMCFKFSVAGIGRRFEKINEIVG